MRKVPLRLLASVVVIVWSVTAGTGIVQAHDLWLTTEGGANARRVIVNYGHPRDRPPTAADKILDLVAVTADKQAVAARRAGAGLRARRADRALESRSPMPDARCSPRATTTATGSRSATNLYRNASKRMAPDAIGQPLVGQVRQGRHRRRRALEHRARPRARDRAARRPRHGPAGRELARARCCSAAQPLAGAEVERGDGLTAVKEDELPRFKTDADGVATIPLPKAGPVLLAIDHRVAPSETPDLAASRPLQRHALVRSAAALNRAHARRPRDRRNFGGRPAIDLRDLVRNLLTGWDRECGCASPVRGRNDVFEHQTALPGLA